MVDIKDYRKEFEKALASNLLYAFNVLRHDLLEAGVSYEDHVSLFEQYLESDLKQQQSQIRWIKEDFLPKARRFLKYKDELAAAYPEKGAEGLALLLHEKELSDNEVVEILSEFMVYARNLKDCPNPDALEDEFGNILDAITGWAKPPLW